MPAEGADGRGRHATPLGQGFGWLVGWTFAGTLLPGTGLLAAGRRYAGALVLGAVALGLTAIAGLVLLGDPLRFVARAAVNPRYLLIAAVGFALLGLLWAVLIVFSHLALRQTAVLTRPQSVVGAVLAAAMIVAVGIPAYKASSYSMITRDTITSVFGSGVASPNDAVRPKAERQDPWASIPRVNVLLIGSDAGSDRDGVRADSLILASIDTATGNAVLFSLPRNLENVPFPLGSPAAEAWPDGYNCGDQCLLNAVWRWGEENRARYYPNDRNPGLTATTSAVEGVLGLNVDYYALLNLKGFQDFVDAIGGIRIDVPNRLPIGGGTSLRGTPLPIYGYIEPGRNRHLSGFKALWFARSRSGSDDYDRMRRQRCVIGAVVQQADPVTVAQGFPRLARSLKRNMSTDIPLRDLDSWVDLTLRVKDAKVRSLPFTNKVINTANPDYDLIHRLVQRSLRAATTSASDPDASTPAASAGATPGASSPPSSNPRVAQDVTTVC